MTLLPSLAGAQGERHGGPVTALAWWPQTDQPDTLISGGFDGRVIHWALDLQAIEQFEHHPVPIDKLSADQRCGQCPPELVISPPAQNQWRFRKTFGDRGRIAIDHEGVAHWQTSDSFTTLPHHFADILDIDIVGDEMLSIERNQSPRLYELNSAQGRDLPAGGIAVAAGRLIDEERALLGTVDGYLSLVSLTTSSILARELAHPAPILAIDISADGDQAITAGANGTITAWRLDEQGLVSERILGQFGFPVFALLLDEPNGRVIVGHKDGHLEALPLLGGEGLSAPPKPAVLFAQSEPTEPGAKLFRACAACHSFAPDGGNKAGPTFAGLIGRPAGSVPGYPYSQALLATDVVWNVQTLSELFKQGPENYLPGTTMPLQRLSNDDERALLIDYLNQQARQTDRKVQP